MAVSTIAGNYGGGIPITCILNEGAPTVTASGTYYGATGQTEKVLTWAAAISENDWVAICDDVLCMYAECDGLPVMELPDNGDTLMIGRVISTPKLQKMPANDAAANDLDERLAGDYYRTAVVEIFGGITAIIKGRVMCDGSKTVVPGVATNLDFNMAQSAAKHELAFDMTGAGVGVIPFHDVPTDTNGVEYSCLVGITGMLKSVAGSV